MLNVTIERVEQIEVALKEWHEKNVCWTWDLTPFNALSSEARLLLVAKDTGISSEELESYRILRWMRLGYDKPPVSR